MELNSVPNLPTCYEVTVHVYSDSSISSAQMEYNSDNWDTVIVTTTSDSKIVIVSPHVYQIVHVLCNLTHSTTYWVQVTVYNKYTFSIQSSRYNFTTDSINTYTTMYTNIPMYNSIPSTVSTRYTNLSTVPSTHGSIHGNISSVPNTSTMYGSNITILYTTILLLVLL